MITKLPEKLLELRKHYGYSQQEIADKMGINVVEYMGWENGRAICNLAQFKLLASIFNVSLEELMHNPTEIQLSAPLDDSIQIPFVNADDETIFFAKKPETETLSTATTEEMSDNKKSENKKFNLTKKQMQLAIGGAAGLLLLLLLLVFWPRSNSEGQGLNLGLMPTERLAAGDKFTVVIDENMKANPRGEMSTLNDFNQVVAVSSRSDFVVGLKQDGTVVGEGSNQYGQLNFSDWKTIKWISAGKSHTVGVKENGSVLCVGSTQNQECNVEDWKDIKFVVAGDNVTMGVTTEGKVLVAGTIQNAGLMQSKTGIIDIAIGSREVVFLKEDGTVETVSITGSKSSDTSAWDNIIQVAVGDHFVAGLDNDGKVHVITEDNQTAAQVSLWENVQVIQGNKKYLVSYDGNKLRGVGDNSSNQYPKEEDVVTLDQVTNVMVKLEEGELNISWDPVQDADSYRVTINTNPSYSQKTEETQVSIPQSKFTEGKTYEIIIVAVDEENELYNSDEKKLDYLHTLLPTATPKYTLTIKYVGPSDEKMEDDFVQEFEVGESYRIASPIIVGYTTPDTYVEGIMESANIIVYVRYAKVATATPSPTPNPTPTPDTTACLITGGTWDEANAQCVCPEGSVVSSDNISCVAQ